MTFVIPVFESACLPAGRDPIWIPHPAFGEARSAKRRMERQAQNDRDVNMIKL